MVLRMNGPNKFIRVQRGQKTLHVLLKDFVQGVRFLLLSLVVPASFEMTERATLPSDGEFTSGRSSADLTVDYLSASWTSADAGDRKSISTLVARDATMATNPSHTNCTSRYT